MPSEISVCHFCFCCLNSVDHPGEFQKENLACRVEMREEAGRDQLINYCEQLMSTEASLGVSKPLAINA